MVVRQKGEIQKRPNLAFSAMGSNCISDSYEFDSRSPVLIRDAVAGKATVIEKPDLTSEVVQIKKVSK
jgi:hypothetical protein